MKKIFLPVALSAAMLFSAFRFLPATHWKIANNYSVKFTSKDPSGIFETMKGEMDLADSKFSIIIDVASINTGNWLMNKIAVGGSWFDAERYPTIKFTSSQILKTSSAYQTTGTLEIHGVKKQIAIPFTFKNNTFAGSFTINRLDYKVGTADGMSAHASTNLFIELSIPVQK